MVFFKFWRRELNLEDMDSIVAVLEEASGGDKHWAQQFPQEAQKLKERLEEIKHQGRSEGVFGVPSIVLGKEVFWGNDRTSFVRKKLKEFNTRNVSKL